MPASPVSRPFPLLFRGFGAILTLSFSAGSVFAQAPAPSAPPATVVKKIAEDFAGQNWIKDQYSKAQGRVSQDAVKAPDAATEKSLKIEVDFAGKGDFEHFSATPIKPLYIPGNARTITMRVKRSEKGAVRIGIVDGWGKGHTWDPRLEDNTDWQTVVYQVPKDMPRPVGIGGVSTYDNSTNKRTYVIQLDDIEAETDITDVQPDGKLKGWTAEPNPADKDKALKDVPVTPLQSVILSTAEQGNIFSDTEPKLTLQIKNWNPGALMGKASFVVTDDTGAKVKTIEKDINVESLAALEIPIEVKRYGIYSVAAAITLGKDAKLEKNLRVAFVPKLRELNDAEKIASPYGLNYHGGGVRLFEAFKKAGFYWIRDYAWGLDMMRRAKGGDRRYAGWPFYPTIMTDYQKLGLIPLPVLHAISPPEMKDGKPVRLGPDGQWVRDMADILISFPYVKYWELDNEYDLKPDNYTPERQVKWQNYELYHKKFAQLAGVLDDSLVTVENGRAGIYPAFEEAAVKDGNFDQLKVLNSHHYTGVEPPEVNYDNFNSGTRLDEGRIAGSFFDALRAVKRASVSDGKNRQAWVTEFGWDTLAGPIVTNEQQAAYLQRGFLLILASGNEKGFWFYNFDSEKGVQFFDGCGLLSHDHQPKLSFAAMAGLSKLLPLPKYIGNINAGPNTWGYVFENEGQLVAGLWTLVGDAPGPKVTFGAGQLYDYLANKIDGKTAQLKMAPVYAVGIDRNDPFYLQTAYSFESNYMIVATAGDVSEVTIGIDNNRDKEIATTIKPILPKGWTAANPEATATVAPGQKQQVKMQFTVGENEKLGSNKVEFAFEEGGKVVKTMPLVVMVQPPFKVEVSPVEGAPGKTSVDVTVDNRSASEQNGTLTLKLPQGWEAPAPSVDITGLKPGEKRVVKMDLVWKPDWKDDESATVVFQPAKGNPVSAAIIPNYFHLRKADKITLDSDLKDWKTRNQVPAWMLGSTVGHPDAKLWFAWAPEGLYGAAEVQNSKAQVSAPMQFWGGDVLELFLSTDPNRQGAEFVKGDHQFWFVPQFKNNDVYVGQWKVKDEIPATRYAIPEVKTSSKRTKDGYIMEFFIPAEVFQQYGLKPGMDIGFSANLTVRGADFDREVFWPRSKAGGTNLKPLTWGRMKIED